MAHPGVGLCRVIGVPDQRYGEQIASFVEFSGQGPVLRDGELRAWVRERLARFKQRTKFGVWANLVVYIVA